MICSNCGTENEMGFKFCVKCGSNMENPAEVNYEAVDRGNYHTEEEFSENSGGFTMNEGTFIIRDTSPAADKKSVYTSDELNKAEEEFDFSMYDEPAAPPVPAPQPVQQPQPQSQPVFPQGGGQPVNPYMQQPVMYAQPQIVGYDQNGMPLYSQPMMYAQPQIIGYDQNGMPLYSQPMMYAQPQIIGYDQNGMPVYGQPQPQPQVIGYDQNGMPVYGQPQPQPQIVGYDQNGMPVYGQPQPQPQIVGYDQNGMPLYGQPMMYAQPQMIGYDQNGMPVYAQPQMQPMGGIPVQGMMQGVPQAIPQQNVQAAEVSAQEAAEPEKEEKQSFWEFFDNGSKETHSRERESDFFGKAEPEPTIPEDPFADIDNRRKKRLQEKMKANGVMGDLPVVDGEKLEKNEPSKMNQLYMRKINDTVSKDLKISAGKHKKGEMAETKEVDASLLSENLNVKSRVSMGDTERVNADDIEIAAQDHREAIMAQADKAVEAMPKKINPYESELDKIELPDYMQAKKKVRDTTVKIPSLPEI